MNNSLNIPVKMQLETDTLCLKAKLLFFNHIIKPIFYLAEIEGIIVEHVVIYTTKQMLAPMSVSSI